MRFVVIEPTTEQLKRSPALESEAFIEVGKEVARRLCGDFGKWELLHTLRVEQSDCESRAVTWHRRSALCTTRAAQEMTWKPRPVRIDCAPARTRCAEPKDGESVFAKKAAGRRQLPRFLDVEVVPILARNLYRSGEVRVGRNENDARMKPRPRAVLGVICLAGALLAPVARADIPPIDACSTQGATCRNAGPLGNHPAR